MRKISDDGREADPLVRLTAAVREFIRADTDYPDDEGSHAVAEQRWLAAYAALVAAVTP